MVKEQALRGEHCTYLHLEVDASGKPVSWRAYCDCGWQGDRDDEFLDARREAGDHYPLGVEGRLRVSWPGKSD